MKKSKLSTLGLAFLMAAGLTLVFSSLGLANCPKQLSAYWKLDEDTGATSYADFMGGNNGTPIGTIQALDPGVVGKAQQFNGTDATISVPGNRTFDWAANESFSIGFWVKSQTAAPLTGDQVIISRWANSNLFWYIGIDPTTGAATFIIKSAATKTDLVVGTTNVADTQWHYVVAVRDAATGALYLYVDGNKESNEGTINNPADLAFGTSAPISIGSFNSSLYFDGALDEMAIYDRALDESEISGYYTNAKTSGTDVCAGSEPFAPFPFSTISLWRLDEVTNPPDMVYADAFGGNNGTGTASIVALDTGVVGKAQMFNGTDTMITVPSHWSFDWGANESFSVEFWVKTTATAPTGSDQIVISRRLDGSHLWYVSVDPGGHAAFIVTGASGANGTVSVTGDTVIADGQWHQVVAERDATAGVLSLYVDGQPETNQGTITNPADLALDPAPIIIGAFNNSLYFDGALDEMALFNSALDANEVNTQYVNGTSGLGIDQQPADTNPGGGSDPGSTPTPTPTPTSSSSGGGGGGGCFISTIF